MRKSDSEESSSRQIDGCGSTLIDMNWTGGGLQRHAGGNNTTARRQRTHFAKVRQRKSLRIPCDTANHSHSQGRGASTLSCDRGSVNPDTGGNNQTRVPKNLSLGRSSNTISPTISNDLDQSRRLLLQHSDWLGLKKPRYEGLQVDHGSRRHRNSTPRRQGPRERQRPRRVEKDAQDARCHGALPAEDIRVRVGTAALMSSSVMPPPGNQSSPGLLSPRMRPVERQHLAADVSRSIYTPVGQCHRNVNLPLSVSATVSDHHVDHAPLARYVSDDRENGMGRRRSNSLDFNIVDDEHYYRAPRSWQDRGLVSAHARPASPTISHVSESLRSYIAGTPHSSLNLFEGFEDATTLKSATVIPASSPSPHRAGIPGRQEATDPGLRQALTGRRVGRERSCCTESKRTPPVQQEEVLGSQTLLKPTTLKPPPPPSPEELWKRFIFGSSPPDLEHVGTDQRMTAIRNEQAGDVLSLAAVVSSSTENDPSGTQLSRSGREQDMVSMMVGTGESRTRAIVLSSDAEESDEEEDESIAQGGRRWVESQSWDSEV